MSWRRNRKVKVLVIMVAVAAILHFSVPPLLDFYVKRTLHNLPGYTTEIKAIHLNLLNGGYSIDSLTLSGVDENPEIPFAIIPRVDVSLHWESLLLGQAVTKVSFINPTINIIADNTPAFDHGYNQIDWSVPLRSLTILPINHVRVRDGVIAFYDLQSNPPVDVFLRNIDIELQNLTNVHNDSGRLPSRAYAQAHSSGDGSLSLVMKMNVMKKRPDLDIDFKFENVNLQRLRGFLTVYANVDVLKGSFNLYSEVTVMNGKIDGYVKPQLDNFMLNGRTQPFQVLMGDDPQLGEGNLGQANSNQLITRVPIDGEIAGRPSQFWPRLWNIFRNASIEGLERNTRDAVVLASAQ